MAALPLLLLALVLLPASAAAQAPAQTPAPATLTLTVAPKGGVGYGEATRLAGRLERRGAPVAGEEVVLEARRFPYRADYAPLRTVRTDAGGRFALRRRFDRNHRVRARAVGAPSAAVSAFVFPRSVLTYRVLRENVLGLTQAYVTPRDVALRATTRFYVGPRGARTAPLRARSRVRRTGAGRAVARATVRVPRSYEGRFQYASCFPYDPRAGMGDPDARCPARAFRFER